MGVRAALGATHSQLRSTIMRGGLAPVVGGVALGGGGALAMMNAVTSFLYGVPAHDPVTFAGVFFLVAIVGTVAVYIPARQVSRIDPVVALRAE
jgi:ABC-type antimicrobial peptide transport system permease subunit